MQKPTFETPQIRNARLRRRSFVTTAAMVVILIATVSFLGFVAFVVTSL